jgi:hypothetical protein
MTSYAYSKNTGDNMPQYETDRLVPFAPAGYNSGRTAWDRTHILYINVVYDLPFGRGRAHLANANLLTDLLLGGWELSGINSFTSGAPLSITVPGATLGNGWDTRADLVGNPGSANPSATGWFNTTAFTSPGLYTFGNSPIGVIEGPGTHSLNIALMKNFHLSETKYFQLRGEAYNALNHVNLNNPGTTLGTSDFGAITGAGSARTIQIGLKFLF